MTIADSPLRRTTVLAAALLVLGACTLNTTMQAQPPPITALVATKGIDLATNTVTLPLHQGSLPDGTNVWYVLLDTNDAETAKRKKGTSRTMG